MRASRRIVSLLHEQGSMTLIKYHGLPIDLCSRILLMHQSDGQVLSVMERPYSNPAWSYPQLVAGN